MSSIVESSRSLVIFLLLRRCIDQMYYFCFFCDVHCLWRLNWVHEKVESGGWKMSTTIDTLIDPLKDIFGWMKMEYKIFQKCKTYLNSFVAMASQISAVCSIGEKTHGYCINWYILTSESCYFTIFYHYDHHKIIIFIISITIIITHFVENTFWEQHFFAMFVLP